MIKFRRNLLEENRKLSELTICFRILMLDFSCPSCWQRVMQLRIGMRDFRLRLRDPDSMGEMVTWVDYEDKEEEVEIKTSGKKSWWFHPLKSRAVPNVWNHVCFRYSVKEKHFLVVHNGEVHVNQSYPESWNKEKAFVPGVVFGPNLNSPNGWKNGFLLSYAKSRFKGVLADLQVWDEAIATEDIFSITRCKHFPVGNLIPWNSENFELSEEINSEKVDSKVTIVQLKTDDMCNIAGKYEYIPGKFDFDASVLTCNQLGGILAETETEKQVEEIEDFRTSIENQDKLYENIQPKDIWTPYTDEKLEGRWAHYSTDNVPKDRLPWLWQEPNGERVENCAGLQKTLQLTSTTPQYITIVYDADCKVTQDLICEAVGTVTLTLRGLCKTTLFDTRYQMMPGTKNRKRFFGGLFGWELYWTGENWMISNVIFNDTFASLGIAKNYPMGKNKWMFFNDDCETDSEVLLLSVCLENEFSCDNGICVPMEARCNGLEECMDVSDEKNCKTVEIDEERYLKEKSPPAEEGEKVQIKIGIRLQNILKIDEIEQLFRTQFHLSPSWFDGRLKLYNIRDSTDMNNLRKSELDLLWVPKLTFSNTAKKEETVRDMKVNAFVTKNGSFVRSDRNSIDNVYVYEGVDNPITMSRDYDVQWRCLYDIRW